MTDYDPIEQSAIEASQNASFYMLKAFHIRKVLPVGVYGVRVARITEGPIVLGDLAQRETCWKVAVVLRARNVRLVSCER